MKRRHALGIRAVTLTGILAVAVVSPAQTQAAETHVVRAGRDLVPIPIDADLVPTARTTVVPRTIEPQVQAGTCPAQRRTYSEADFLGGQFVLQAGFVETEVAAVSITLDPSDFPVIFHGVETIIGADALQVEATTEYTILIWDGTPESGTLVATYSSDGVLIPHVVMPPSSQPQAVNLQLQIDPTAPNQVVLQNSMGTNTFSVGFRLDRHNDPPTSACSQGLNPPACCPPSTDSNMFPTTDTLSPALPTFPTENWVLCRSGCGPTSCPGGWYRFSELGAWQPHGDWNMAVTFSTFDCDPGAGACCLGDGSCVFETPENCVTMGGVFQSTAVSCIGLSCGALTGACCIDGFCGNDVTESECVAAGGVFLGDGAACQSSSCVGACCIPGSGGCLSLTEDECISVVQGIFHGPGSDCSSIVCFPMGACCLPDGTCEDAGGAMMSPEDCATLEGVFQGDGSDCATAACPEPIGACCLPGGCLEMAEVDCDVASGTWTGSEQTCDACLSCPADLSGDGGVGFNDLTALLAGWGPCGDCPEDLSGDGSVGFDDLTTLLAGWGPC